jgi:hypothetical protein
MYWSHASDIGPVNWCSWSATYAWLYPYHFNGCCGRETGYGPMDRSADVPWIGTGALFLGSSSSFQRYWRLCERLTRMGTVHRKLTSGIRGLAWKAYMSCVLCFPCREYIDSIHRDSCICRTRFLCQNRVLIVCMTEDQMFHTYGQKCSQITKCHSIEYNYYINNVFKN